MLCFIFWALHKPCRRRGGPLPRPRPEELPTWGRRPICTHRATRAAWPLVLLPRSHHRGLASRCLPSHNLPAKRPMPSPRHCWSPRCWFCPQGPQHPGPQPTGTPQHQLPPAGGDSRCTKPAPTRTTGPSQARTLFKWQAKLHEGCSPARLNVVELAESISTARSGPGPQHTAEMGLETPTPRQSSGRA